MVPIIEQECKIYWQIWYKCHMESTMPTFRPKSKSYWWKVSEIVLHIDCAEQPCCSELTIKSLIWFVNASIWIFCFVAVYVCIVATWIILFPYNILYYYTIEQVYYLQYLIFTLFQAFKYVSTLCYIIPK